MPNNSTQDANKIILNKKVGKKYLNMNGVNEEIIVISHETVTISMRQMWFNKLSVEVKYEHRPRSYLFPCQGYFSSPAPPTRILNSCITANIKLKSHISLEPVSSIVAIKVRIKSLGEKPF